MTNNIRQLLNKIAAESSDPTAVKKLKKNLYGRGITMVRLSQLVNNHRQPSTEEAIIILDEMKPHIEGVDFAQLINLKENQ